MQNLCQLQGLHTHTQSHVAAEDHKLHKTGPRNGHSRIVQLGTGWQREGAAEYAAGGQLGAWPAYNMQNMQSGLQGGGSN